MPVMLISERFKNVTLQLSHMLQNGQFVFYVYAPISKAYGVVLYFSSFLPFGVCFEIALNWCWYNFSFQLY